MTVQCPPKIKDVVWVLVPALALRIESLLTSLIVTTLAEVHDSCSSGKTLTEWQCSTATCDIRAVKCDCTPPGQCHQDTCKFDHLWTSAGTRTDNLRCCARTGLILQQVNIIRRRIKTLNNIIRLLCVPHPKCHLVSHIYIPPAHSYEWIRRTGTSVAARSRPMCSPRSGCPKNNLHFNIIKIASGCIISHQI